MMLLLLLLLLLLAVLAAKEAVHLVARTLGSFGDRDLELRHARDAGDTGGGTLGIGGQELLVAVEQVLLLLDLALLHDDELGELLDGGVQGLDALEQRRERRWRGGRRRWSDGGAGQRYHRNRDGGGGAWLGGRCCSCSCSSGGRGGCCCGCCEIEGFGSRAFASRLGSRRRGGRRGGDEEEDDGLSGSVGVVDDGLVIPSRSASVTETRIGPVLRRRSRRVAAVAGRASRAEGEGRLEDLDFDDDDDDDDDEGDVEEAPGSVAMLRKDEGGPRDVSG